MLGRRRAIPLIDLPAVSPATAGPGPYAVPAADDQDQVAIFRPNLWELWRGTFRALWLVGRFLVRGRRTMRSWRDAFPYLSGQDYWASVFGPPSDGEAEDNSGK